jgi:hypothetical protein
MPNIVRINDRVTWVVADPGQPQTATSKDTLFALADANIWRRPELVTLDEKKWWSEPLTDTTIIPKSARKRVDQILKSMPVKNLYVWHEIEVEPKTKPLPWVLPPEPKREPIPWVLPEPAPKPYVPWTMPDPNIDWPEVGRTTWAVTKEVLKVVGYVLLGVVFVLAILGGGCLKDPMVVVETVEGECYSVYRDFS